MSSTLRLNGRALRRLVPILAGILVWTGCGDSSSVQPAGIDLPPTTAVLPGPQPRPGHYIVVLKEDIPDVAREALRLSAAYGGRVERTYGHAIKGFAAEMTPSEALRMEANPGVDFVEEDQVFSIETTQNNPTWGLDRVDQRSLPLNNTYVYGATGAAITVYVLDTGIRTSHAEFGPNRASGGFTSVNDGNGTADCNGHGTHVAGTVGGSTYGVAKSVRLVAVRVLDCQGNGTTSGVIAGVDWVTQNHQSPAVANMSLGGGSSAALDAAVRGSIASGVTYSISAGNGDAFGNPLDACTRSPARVAEALTVAASTRQDKRASFSNFGTCVDLFAPGVGITSAFNSGDHATAVLSGTSMAAPHVTGAAALFLEGNPTASPASVAVALTSNATAGAIGNPGSGTANLLLFTGFIGVGPPPPTAPPANPVGPFT
ncbi:MAG: S8 family peptidase, partial [Gemmatimonadota bacterium]